MELLRHVKVRSLEHLSRNAERDAVHEVTLPELQRGRRSFLEPGEVGEVAAERCPTLRLQLGRLRPLSPEPNVEHGYQEHECVREAGKAEHDHEHV